MNKFEFWKKKKKLLDKKVTNYIIYILQTKKKFLILKSN